MTPLQFHSTWCKIVTAGAEQHRDTQKGAEMIDTAPTNRYRFRPGALDHIMRSRNLTTDAQLAALIGVRTEDLPRLRAGTPVTPELAMYISTIQGDEHYITGLFEPVQNAA